MAEGGGGSSSGGCSVGMEAPAKVRVVRCPKCEKLLPELAGFGVYRCGGCSATLQAMTAKVEEPSVGVAERCDVKMERSSGEATVCFYSDELPLEGNAKVFGGDELEVNGGYPSRIDQGGFGSEECNAQKSDCIAVERQVMDRGSRCHLRPSKAPVDNCFSAVDQMVRDGHDKSRGKRMPVENGSSMQQVQFNGVVKHENGDSVSGIQSTPRTPSQGAWLSPDEGSSNFAPRRNHGHVDGSHVLYGNPGLPNRVENLEQDRAELLRKLDELREQLSQSCKTVDVLNERVPASNAGQNLYSNGFHSQNGRFHGGAPPFNQPSATHPSFMNEPDLHMQNYHPALRSQNEMLGYAMPLRSRMISGAPYESHSFAPQRASPNFACGKFDQDPVVPYPFGMYYPQSGCSCSHLCNQHWQAPSQASNNALVSRRGPYHANGHGFYPVNGSLDSEFLPHGVLNPVNCQSLPFKNYNDRDCQPFAGGAPFVVCCNCSELLQVPQKHFLMGKGQYKLRCGSCCQVISVELDKDGLLVSAPLPPIGINLQSNRVINERRNQVLFDPYPGEYNRSSFNPRSADEKVVLPTYPPLSIGPNDTMENDVGLNLAEAENMEGMSSSSSGSKDDRSPDETVRPRDASSSRELQKPEVHSRVQGLPLREHFGYPPSSITANRSGSGSRSKRSDQEKVVCVNGSFKQNSVKDVSVATEMDLLVDEYPNHRLSEDSDEASKEDDLPRSSKGGESFFTGLIKKSFKHSENRKFKVSINGHLLPDRVVKKAEKQAGPIQPGDYWYDCQAGFWGAMGQHCLGIIPPFIEELSYPMPKNCAGGDTGVLVNGRELHQKDLDLLAGRGLPTSRDKSYIIDISGKVSDAISGEDLDGLGKLAPTVEKMKHGFGMRMPKETTD